MVTVPMAVADNFGWPITINNKILTFHFFFFLLLKHFSLLNVSDLQKHCMNSMSSPVPWPRLPRWYSTIFALCFLSLSIPLSHYYFCCRYCFQNHWAACCRHNAQSSPYTSADVAKRHSWHNHGTMITFRKLLLMQFFYLIYRHSEFVPLMFFSRRRWI